MPADGAEAEVTLHDVVCERPSHVLVAGQHISSFGDDDRTALADDRRPFAAIEQRRQAGIVTHEDQSGLCATTLTKQQIDEGSAPIGIDTTR